MYRLFYAALIVVWLWPAAALAGETYLSGTIIGPKGQPIKATKIESNSIQGRLKGNFMKIPFADLARIDNLGNEVAKVTNKDGKEFLLDRAKFRNDFKYSFFNEVIGKEQNAQGHWDGIQAIVFGQYSGQVKINPKTGRYFPIDYLFDPYTGEELVLSD